MTGIGLATKGIIGGKKEIIVKEISGSMDGGNIVINNGWQLITVPVQYGYWDDASGDLVHTTITKATIYNYVIKQLEDKYNVPAKDLIEIASTYIGSEGKFKSFIPGVTNPLSTNNFQFAYEDNGILEYTGFWIKSISPSPLTVRWGE